MTTRQVSYCKCGAKMDVTVDNRSAEEGALDQLFNIMWHVHSGAGHGPSTPEAARKARYRAERERATPPEYTGPIDAIGYAPPGSTWEQK